jgi:hypothetical protein
LKKNLLLSLLLVFITIAHAQKAKVDSIYFHLYTDSLKKGVHNYINVDGKLSDGRWIPLMAKDISLTTTGGQFEGNDLVIPRDFAAESVTVTAFLKSNPAVTKQVTIFIKKKENDELLKTNDEIMNEVRKQPARKSKKKQ